MDHGALRGPVVNDMEMWRTGDKNKGSPPRNKSTHPHLHSLAGKTYRSRLLVGTGRYKSMAETKAAVEASGAEIVTVALRRMDLIAKARGRCRMIKWTRPRNKCGDRVIARCH